MAIDFMVNLFSLSIFYVKLEPRVVELTKDKHVNGLEKDVDLVMSVKRDLVEGESNCCC